MKYDKITIFTSNQPRHISLINKLSNIANKVYAFIECNTIFPGKVQDFFDKSETMQRYFSQVMWAEKDIFGDNYFINSNVHTFCCKMGDISSYSEKNEMALIQNGLSSDKYIVFGSSYIKGELCNFLVENKTINIHMGVSPYYRGSSCNFWAMYDENYDKVGATIHLLSNKLDAGDILCNALPNKDVDIRILKNPFLFTMNTVKIAHNELLKLLTSEKKTTCIKQDKTKEIRYTKNKQFNDNVAQEFMGKHYNKSKIIESLSKRDDKDFILLEK